MNENKKLDLPSGATLEIMVAPFPVSKALFQAVMEEAQGLHVKSDQEVFNLWKDVFCKGYSSKKIEVCLGECLKRCLYNGKKIDDQTFEPVAARDDYLKVMYEVTKENIAPFLKSLLVEYAPMLEKLRSILA